MANIEIVVGYDLVCQCLKVEMAIMNEYSNHADMSHLLNVFNKIADTER